MDLNIKFDLEIVAVEVVALKSIKVEERARRSIIFKMTRKRQLNIKSFKFLKSSQTDSYAVAQLTKRRVSQCYTDQNK